MTTYFYSSQKMRGAAWRCKLHEACNRSATQLERSSDEAQRNQLLLKLVNFAPKNNPQLFVTHDHHQQSGQE
jgi:hypothetical protein